MSAQQPESVFVALVLSVVAINATAAKPATAANAHPVIVKSQAMKKTNVRIACGGDLERIHEIDFDSSINPYSLEEWKELLKDTFKVILVSENDKTITGFCELRPTTNFVIINKICVSPEYRKIGIGCEIIKYLKTFGISDTQKISAIIPDSELATHRFLKKNSFKCVKTCKNFFDEEDGYLFIWESSQELIAI